MGTGVAGNYLPDLFMASRPFQLVDSIHVQGGQERRHVNMW
jgi:hypothetical protein